MLTSTFARGQLDLSQCEHEPIHIPGAIQSHGVLLVLDEPSLNILQISDNCADFFERGPGYMVGKPLHEFFDPGFFADLREKLLNGNLKELNPLRISLTAGSEWKSLNGVAHRTKQALILELEPARLKDYDAFLGFYQPARSAISRLREAKTLDELCATLVEEISLLTNFDRVVVYSFDEAWNGKVVAEKLNANIDSYLGLHFPASDIPKQARALYAQNRSRYIPDVDYRQSSLYPELHPLTNQPLDLSFAALRSVSPVHREYLRNMQCTSSMSISLLKEGKLWGLVSCTHSNGPRFVPYEVRSLCEFLGEITSSFLSSHEQTEYFEERIQARSLHATLLERMTRVPDFISALIADRPNLLDLTKADGAAVYFQGRCHVTGNAPSDEELLRLIQWLSEQPFREDLFVTDGLAQNYPPAARFKESCAGLIAAPLSHSRQSYVLWFRPEVVQTVNWGGNPNKAVEQHENSVRLHPRKSFNLWKETVRLKSLPWAPHEREAAEALQKSIMDVVLQQNEGLFRLNLELKRSNSELDSFAYAASHDLKEPLRGIHNYATYLQRQESSKMGETSQKRLATVIALTQRMENLINSLLHYAQVGRMDLLLRDTDLHEVVEQVLESLRHRIEETHAEIRLPGRLPTVRGDRVRLMEMFSNFVSNALKYNDKPNRWVEIGFEERASLSTIFYVRDNGLGIRLEFHDAVFKIFRRLHQRDKFGGGTGTGLTIAKRIIERHNGRIWLESEEGVGTTFYFTLEGEEPVADQQ